MVDTASPSKVTACVGWAPGDWNLRLQSQQTFDVSDDGDYTKANSPGPQDRWLQHLDFLGSYSLPVGKISFSVENLLDKQYTTVWGQRADPVQPDLRLA